MESARSGKVGGYSKMPRKRRKPEKVVQVYPPSELLAEDEEAIQYLTHHSADNISRDEEDGQNYYHNKEELCAQTMADGFTAIDSQVLADAITEFIITDMQLPDIVEGRGFQRLVATLRSPCEIPSKVKLEGEIIPKVYENVREAVLPSVAILDGIVSLSIEDWTSGFQTCSTVTLHFIQQGDGMLQSRSLGTIFSDGEWGAQFDDLLHEWDLHVDQIQGVIVASDRLTVFDELTLRDLTPIPCFAKVLEDACVIHCLESKEVAYLVKKTRTLIALINCNSNLSSIFKLQESCLPYEENSFTTDTGSEWVTTVNMLEGLLLRKKLLPHILQCISTGLCPTESLEYTPQEWSQMEDVVNILNTLKVTFTTLVEEKTPIISIVKPILWQLLRSHLVKTPQDSPFAARLKSQLHSFISKQYEEPKVQFILGVSSFLDPRFKNIPFITESERVELKKKLKEMLSLLRVEEQFLKEESPSKNRRSGMECLLGNLVVGKRSCEQTSEEKADQEMAQFGCAPEASLESSPLDWWWTMEGASKCLRLSLLAAHYLCIPSSLARMSPPPPPAHLSLPPHLVHQIKVLNINFPPATQLPTNL